MNRMNECVRLSDMSVFKGLLRFPPPFFFAVSELLFSPFRSFRFAFFGQRYNNIVM